MRTRKEWVIGPSFEEFFGSAERPVRYALCARYGFDTGREATAEAFAYAWENWERLEAMSNPAGYVYRVGQRIASRLSRRRPPALDRDTPVEDTQSFEPKLEPALRSLSLRQRQSVVLVHAIGMTHSEAAAMLGISASSIQRHLERGLARLRDEIGVEDA